MPITAEGREFSKLTTALFSLILTMDDARGAMGERLGIGMTGLKTLSILNRQGPTPAGDLAKTAGITSGSMTATVDKLVKSGLATRTMSTIDRRSVLVDLTDEGVKAMQWVLGYYFDALALALPDVAEIDAISNYIESTAKNLRILTDAVPTLPPAA